MTWTQRRRSELPDNWETLRSRVLRRDRYRCQMRLAGCLGDASEVDHIRRGSDHSETNLRAVCRSCHGRKSAAEGHKRRAELRALRKRPTERHPGSR